MNEKLIAFICQVGQQFEDVGWVTRIQCISGNNICMKELKAAWFNDMSPMSSQMLCGHLNKIKLIEYHFSLLVRMSKHTIRETNN